jgi:alcohol dehydrogenase
MVPFDFHPRTRFVFGPDRVDELGLLAAELGARRAMVVSDPGIVRIGHTERGVASLLRAGVEARVFDDVQENPTTDNVDAGLRVAEELQPDLIIGLGGGSSMDCAKGVNFVYTGGGRMQDYWGVGKASQPLLPMIAVPTTAGTGSESQSYALISDAQTKVKMACGDKKASFRVALLDPKLTITQPREVTALTGIDAIAHALETYVTKPRNAASLAFSREAWTMLADNFAHVLDNPEDLDARGGMQLGACFGGLAIENSMLGAAHALANPLTATYGVVHGQAVSVMLPHVIRFNGETVNYWYRDLLETTMELPGCPDPRHGAEGLATFVTELLVHAGLKTTLRELGVDGEKLPELAAHAAEQWTGRFNPRDVGQTELLSLYEKAF